LIYIDILSLLFIADVPPRPHVSYIPLTSHDVKSNLVNSSHTDQVSRSDGGHQADPQTQGGTQSDGGPHADPHTQGGTQSDGGLHADSQTQGTSQCKSALAIFDYHGDTTEDLSFHVGETIEILAVISADWMNGRIDERKGMFPLAFVQLLH